jgi:hypothetical protein
MKKNSDLKSTFQITREMSEKIFVIPPHRTRYLSEIAESNRNTTFQQLAKNVAQNYTEFQNIRNRF